jgi:hypothetical protein
MYGTLPQPLELWPVCPVAGKSLQRTPPRQRLSAVTRALVTPRGSPTRHGTIETASTNGLADARIPGTTSVRRMTAVSAEHIQRTRMHSGATLEGSISTISTESERSSTARHTPVEKVAGSYITTGCPRASIVAGWGWLDSIYRYWMPSNIGSARSLRSVRIGQCSTAGPSH